MDEKRIPCDLQDQVKLCTYLSPGDLWLLWTSFKSVCGNFQPGQPASVTRPIKNLCDFWKSILNRSTEAAEAGQYPLECTIIFCRGDFLASVVVVENILLRPDRNWLTESRKKALGELRKFFLDRLYDPAPEQGSGAPFRLQDALLNDLYVGKKMRKPAQNLPSPQPQRVFILAVVIALLMPPERQPFSITSVAALMARMFGWNPMRTLDEINNLLNLSGREPDYRLDFQKYESGLIRVVLPKRLDYELPELMPSPPFPKIVAFAVAIALLVPDENRRRPLALQSIALLMHDLFGWPMEQVTQEINLCVEVWNADGIGPNFWTDEAGHINVGLPKK